MSENTKTNSSEELLLQVRDLHTSFFTDSGEVQAVNGVSFNLSPGKILGVVGESGSGKSVTAYSIMQILAETGKVVIHGRLAAPGGSAAPHQVQDQGSSKPALH